MKLVSGIFIVALIMSGCAQQQSQVEKRVEQSAQKSGLPSWIFNPSMGGKLGGVGASLPHVKGVSAQRTMAIARAFDEIARQMGTTVDTTLATQTIASNGSASSTLQTYSVHTTSGKVVVGEVREFWFNEQDNNLYVWVVTK